MALRTYIGGCQGRGHCDCRGCPCENAKPIDSCTISVGLKHELSLSALESDPERWPLLRRALRAVTVAYNPKVEWLVNGSERCSLGHLHNVTKADYNYTQIFRITCSRTAVASGDRTALEILFDNIETALLHGTRRCGPQFRTMGGVQDLLGRWPRKTDHLELTILRDLERRPSYHTDANEWLVELSLRAYAKGPTPSTYTYQEE